MLLKTGFYHMIAVLTYLLGPNLSARYIRKSLSKVTDPQVIVGLSRALALSHNAHTRLYLLRMETVLRRYPLRLWWFGNEPYVVKATPAYKATLGCRVLAIGAYDPQAVRASVRNAVLGQ